MTIGLYTIIAVQDMQVMTYAFQTYELALAQAHFNDRGITAPVERLPETRQPNGLRQTVWKYPRVHELIVVQELEIAVAILPVSP